MTYPSFAVVGHPNKGKSSIVASLAYDDSIDIAARSGTTVISDSYALKIDGKVLYALYDTPGFQRPSEVLSLIEKNITDASSRANAVKDFVTTHKDNPRYKDEIELLTPIVHGSGILYVVDGSKPYADEYEAQMQILRYLSAPSMALINMIDEDDYIDEWKDALSQYFKIVRVFNPLKISHDKHIALLRAMAQLNESWTANIEEAILALNIRQSSLKMDSARVISDCVAATLSLEIKKTFLPNDDEKSLETNLQQSYQKALHALELKALKEIKTLWSHQHLVVEDDVPFFDEDLFSEKSEEIFGLSKKELLKTAAMSGAAIGGGFDLLVGGSSLMLGATLGAIIGAGGSYFGYEKIGNTRILGQKLSSQSMVVGPMKEINFAFILLARLIIYTKAVMDHSHADKQALERKKYVVEQLFDKKEISHLQKHHLLMRKGAWVNEKEAYTKMLVDALGNKD